MEIAPFHIPLTEHAKQKGVYRIRRNQYPTRAQDAVETPESVSGRSEVVHMWLIEEALQRHVVFTEAETGGTIQLYHYAFGLLS